jgi:hypothetical protein
MATEIINLEVKSNIKGATKDVDALAKSVEMATYSETELNDVIDKQRFFLAEQRTELRRLKDLQDSIPEGAYYAGQSKLTADIKKVTRTIRDESDSLKDLVAQQKANNKVTRDSTIARKRNNNAAIRGIQHFQVMGVSIRSLKNMIRGIVPMFNLLFGTIKAGIASTGIGVLILALISIGTSMKKTVAGGKAFKVMMAAIGAVTKAVTDTLTFLGDAMLSVFGFDSSTVTAVSSAEALEKAYERLGIEMDKIALKELENQKARVDNKRIIDDTTKSEEERLKASNENAKADKEILEAKIAAQKKVISAAQTNHNKMQSWHKWEQKNALAADVWNKVANDTESAFSKSRDAKTLATKKLNTATQELQKLENQLYTDSLAAEDELVTIRQTNADQAVIDAEKLEETRKKNAEARKQKRDKTAADELSIAKQLEKVKQELFYRTLETEQEVEEAKLEDAKKSADQAILDSTASKEVKDAALLVLEEKFQSDLAAIQTKADDKAFDKKIADNDAWNKQQLADQEITNAKKKKSDDLFESEKQKSIAMGFDAASSLAKEGSGIAKGIAVARTIFNTQQAIMNAMATVPAPFNIAQSIATGVMGAAAIQKILSTNPEDGGGGGGGAAATPTPPAPEMMSGAFTLGGGQEVEPTRAYVVSDDITANQNKLAIIRRRATI